VTLGPRARLGERAVIVALREVALGEAAVLGDWAAISDADRTFGDAETPVRHQPLRVSPVRVGAGAVIGPHAALGPGAEVAPGEEVAPYAVVGAGPRPDTP
jgi:acetyltransferase-like isoleucine patch superfamily enzyme